MHQKEWINHFNVSYRDLMLKEILHRFSLPTGRYDLISLPPAGQHIVNVLTNDERRTRSHIITTYSCPDLDGIAAAVALSEFLTTRLNYLQCEAMFFLEPQVEAQWIMSRLSLDLPQLSKVDEMKEFILVDVSDPKDIPDLVPRDQVKIVIDHRSYDKTKGFEKVEGIWIEEMGSAATLIGLLLQHAKYQLSQLAANLLYLAILSNTIKCKSHNTKPQDVSILSWLEQYIEVDDTFVDEMFRAKSVINNIEWAIDYDMSSVLVVIEGKRTAIGQLELVDARQFVTNNKTTIFNALENIRFNRHADTIFLIVIDTFLGHTYFVFTDEHMLRIIEQVLKGRTTLFKELHAYICECNDVFIRKEMIPLIMDR